MLAVYIRRSYRCSNRRWRRWILVICRRVSLGEGKLLLARSALVWEARRVMMGSMKSICRSGGERRTRFIACTPGILTGEEYRVGRAPQRAMSWSEGQTAKVMRCNLHVIVVVQERYSLAGGIFTIEWHINDCSGKGEGRWWKIETFLCCGKNDARLHA